MNFFGIIELRVFVLVAMADRAIDLIRSVKLAPDLLQRSNSEVPAARLGDQGLSAASKRSRRGTCVDFNLRRATSSEKKHA